MVIGRARNREMDDYTREMMDLKTLVTRTLEKKGVLARIRVHTHLRVSSSQFLTVDPFNSQLRVILPFSFCLRPNSGRVCSKPSKRKIV